MYINLKEILDVIDIYPIKLVVNNEMKIINDKNHVNKIYHNYEVIKLSSGTDAITIIEVQKYGRMTDENYSYEIGV